MPLARLPLVPLLAWAMYESRCRWLARRLLGSRGIKSCAGESRVACPSRLSAMRLVPGVRWRGAVSSRRTRYKSCNDRLWRCISLPSGWRALCLPRAYRASSLDGAARLYASRQLADELVCSLDETVSSATHCSHGSTTLFEMHVLGEAAVPAGGRHRPANTLGGRERPTLHPLPRRSPRR